VNRWVEIAWLKAIMSFKGDKIPLAMLGAFKLQT